MTPALRGPRASLRALTLASLLASLAGPLVFAQETPPASEGSPATDKPAEAAADKPAIKRVRSPFLPKGFGDASARPLNQPTNTPLDQLEFRGLSVMGADKLYSVFDPSSSRGYWLKPGETQAGYTLVSYNESAKSVLVRSAAGERTVPLKAVGDGAAPAGGQTMGGVAQRPVMVAPLAQQAQAANKPATLPTGAFPIASGQPVPPGYTLAQALPSNAPGAVPPGTTYAIPPGNPLPAGFTAVAAPASNNATQNTPPPRRRIIVDQRSRTPQQPQQPTR